MIDIKRKEECTGCGACADICPVRAISLVSDQEGFSYPLIDAESCTKCGLCDKTCGELHVNKLRNDGSTHDPIVYAAVHKDKGIRVGSTSGGLFSAFANDAYAKGTSVAGAVYEDDFKVRHIVSNSPEDLLRIRGSKHCQSDTGGFFVEVRRLLQNGEKVLVCAAPCQIVSLRLFLGDLAENLTTIDFICLGINSPKVFSSYLGSLEKRYASKAVSVQAKNKDLGWRSLAYKIVFANDKKYVQKGAKDGFIRGFIEAHLNCRPSCYECKYKGFPRISDITLGDFWGIENVRNELDDNMGTSVVFLNSRKGVEAFDRIREAVTAQPVPLDEVLRGNPALVNPIKGPLVDRNDFYRDLDKMPFDDVVKKYYPLENRFARRVKNGFSVVSFIWSQMGFGPKAYMQFIWVNCMRANTRASILKRKYLLPFRDTVMYLSKNARISLNGTISLGYKRIRGSRLETRFAVEGDGSIAVERGSVTAYYGTDILVFKGAALTFKGDAIINQCAQIICMDNIIIGADVMISRDVVIRDNDGGHEIVAEGYQKTAPVVIGDHVWIGQGAMIMKGVTIGDGAIISAGAWVVSNVKPKSIVMGDPSRTVKQNAEWRK